MDCFLSCLCFVLQLKLEVATGDIKSFTFDHVLDETCSQQQLYQTAVSPLIEQMLAQRVHATVMAYGQTRSG
jgi:hypothetical protein